MNVDSVDSNTSDHMYNVVYRVKIKIDTLKVVIAEIGNVKFICTQ